MAADDPERARRIRDTILSLRAKYGDAAGPKVAAFVEGTRQAIAAKDARTQREIEAGFTPGPPSLGQELGSEAKNIASSMWGGAKALGSAAIHPIDTVTTPAKRRELERGVDDMVTLGYGQKVADWAGRKLGDTPDQQLGATAEADAQAAPGFRTAGNMVGMAVPGAGGVINKAGGAVAGKMIGKGASVAGEALRGVPRALMGYELTAPVIAGAQADAAGHRLDRAVDVATNPVAAGTAAVLGGAGAALGETVRGAPARAEESELGALKEGVQYKTRVQQYEANKGPIREQLGQERALRSAIKSDPQKAQPMVDEALARRAEETLQPFYDRMKATGQDGVPVDLVTKRLAEARNGFHDIAEEGQVKVLDHLIDRFNSKAEQNDGVLPAQYLREASTSFQGQGNANVPMFGPVALTKRLKQDVGNSLRSAIADHVESLADDPAAGTALKDAFRSANKDVRTWYAIKNIVDEKAKRTSANASATGDIVHAGVSAIKHPITTALGLAGPITETADRRILAPVVESRIGQAAAPVANAALGAATSVTPASIIESRRRERERERILAERAKRGQ